MKIKIYGSRGTIALFNRNNIRYGGNTPCIRLDSLGRTLILDGGSGLVQLGKVLQKEAGGCTNSSDDINTNVSIKADILLSHLHLDHIIGLSAFTPLWKRGNNIRIYTVSRGEQSLDKQIFGAFKPPYWPVDLSEISCAECIEIREDEVFRLNGNIKITPFNVNHSDRTTGFRVDCIEEGKSVVYLLDNEVGGDSAELDRLAAYCCGADAVVFDSTYLPQDYDDKLGWGHSTYRDGMMLAERSACKRMIFAHFSQDYSDITLSALADKIEGLNTRYFLAFDGMEIDI